MKLNANVLVNRLKDSLLGNKTDLTLLTQTWDAMRAPEGNINSWLELHIIDHGFYIRISQWILTPIIFLTGNIINSIYFMLFQLQEQTNLNNPLLLL